jgi:hypothetical protein
MSELRITRYFPFARMKITKQNIHHQDASSALRLTSLCFFRYLCFLCNGLKIRVSAVQIRPCPFLFSPFQSLPSGDFLSLTSHFSHSYEFDMVGLNNSRYDEHMTHRGTTEYSPCCRAARRPAHRRRKPFAGLQL